MKRLKSPKTRKRFKSLKIVKRLKSSTPSSSSKPTSSDPSSVSSKKPTYVQVDDVVSALYGFGSAECTSTQQPVLSTCQKEQEKEMLISSCFDICFSFLPLFAIRWIALPYRTTNQFFWLCSLKSKVNLHTHYGLAHNGWGEICDIERQFDKEISQKNNILEFSARGSKSLTRNIF
jgi:hypothetical protein